MKKPNCIEKRSVLHGSKTSREELVRMGEEFLASGALADAIAFFLRSEHREGLERIRSLLVEEGDTFFLRQLAQRPDLVEVTSEHWLEAARRAERAGKIRFAAAAYREGGDEASASRLSGETSPAHAESPSASDDPVSPDGAG